MGADDLFSSNGVGFSSCCIMLFIEKTILLLCALLHPPALLGGFLVHI